MADAVDALIEDLRRYAAEQRTLAEQSEAAASAARTELSQVEEALAALGHAPAAASGRRRRPASKPAAPRARRGENQAKVLALVTERPGVTPGEVAQTTGVKQAVVYNVLRTLDTRGEIERTDLGGGRTGYRLADEATSPAPQEPGVASVSEPENGEPGRGEPVPA